MTTAQLYRDFCYPPEIISHVVWIYRRFSLSFRDIEELMASCSISVTYETIQLEQADTKLVKLDGIEQQLRALKCRLGV